MTARTRKHKHALTELEQVSCSWKRENLQWFTVYNTTCVYIGEVKCPQVFTARVISSAFHTPKWGETHKKSCPEIEPIVSIQV